MQGRRLGSEEARDLSSTDRAVEYLRLHARGVNLLELLRLKYGARRDGGAEDPAKNPLPPPSPNSIFSDPSATTEVPGAEAKYFLYRLSTGWAYSWVVTVAMTVHLALAFWEAPSRLGQPDLVTRRYWLNTLAASGVCLGVETVDMMICLHALGANVYVVDAKRGLIARKLDRRRLLLVALIWALLVDWLVGAAGYYFYHVLTSGGRFHLILPYSSVLRPLLLVLRFESFARYMKDLIVTINKSKGVLILVLMAVLLAAIWNQVGGTGRRNPFTSAETEQFETYRCLEDGGSTVISSIYVRLSQL
jgi:hypothetical protein